jgi:Fibronectin type III domain/Chitobiase/beta-hexosaminidase C-terminal domain
MSSRSSSSTSPCRPARRRLTRRVAAGVTASVAVLGASGAIVASAAPPAFPDNIVVFPDRDFVTIEGLTERAGQEATVEVSRGSQVVGSAKAIISGGDPAFEINHPGGVCWGNGTGLQVTPDIKAGDKVTLKVGSTVIGDTTVQPVAVTQTGQYSQTSDGRHVVTVSGTIGNANPTQLEQRIVNPELTDTDVTRRDVRAVPGGLAPAPKGGYSSNLEVTGDQFKATYEFATQGTAELAASGGGERIMSWEVQDDGDNRQGLTISEAGEAGGPGMGGCPAGPGEQGAPTPGNAVIQRSTDRTSVKVNWSPAEPAPGAAAVTGYSIVAIADTVTDGQQVQLGTRTGANATGTTINGLKADENYTVEVRSLTGTKMSEAFSAASAGTPGGGAGDQTAPPAVTSQPAGGTTEAPTEADQVTVSSESGAQVFFTTGDTPVLSADLPSDAAKLVNGPITITETTRLNFVAFDDAGNHSPVTSGVFTKKAVPTVPAPTVAPTVDDTSSGGQGSVTLKWNATSDASVTGYDVELTKAGSAPQPLRETSERNLILSGLASGDYTFRVRAKNATGSGPFSARSATLKVTDRITITSARWKAGDFRIGGTGSQGGVTVTVYGPSTSNPTVMGSQIGTPGSIPTVAPFEFSLRFRNGAAPARNPGRIWVKSSGGAVSGPFTVTNG